MQCGFDFPLYCLLLQSKYTTDKLYIEDCNCNCLSVEFLMVLLSSKSITFKIWLIEHIVTPYLHEICMFEDHPQQISQCASKNVLLQDHSVW